MTTTTYTHEFSERGNGFPSIGEDVIYANSWGEIRLLTVTGISSIQTAQWQANMIYLTCENSNTDWDDLNEEEQEDYYKRLHHVNEIKSEDEDEDND